MSDDSRSRSATETDRIDRAVAAERERGEERTWRADINEHVATTEKRLTSLEEVLNNINLHLATIDTNFAWIVRVLKWIGGPIAAYYGISGAVQ